jgi:RimJ/RimL family protein N-acetyltransferase
MDQLSIELRPVTEKDLWLFERQAVQPDDAGLFNWSGFRNVVAIRRRFADDGLLGTDDGYFIVRVSDESVGTVVWRRVCYGAPSWWCWNIGVSLLPEHRGKGVGSAGQAALVGYLFDTTPVQRIEAYTDVENIAEQRALEKIKFTREGTLRSSQFRDGRWRDMLMYSITRPERIESQHQRR